MPTTRIYAKQIFSSWATALPDIVRFLINDHQTITGPGWTIVEAQSGANREVPPDPTDLDSLVSATAWSAGTVAFNDWIVLESANANNTNHFQVYIEYQAANNINFMMIPLEDFSTGGGAASPPTFPSTAFALGGALSEFTKDDGAVIYNVIADEGMMTMLVDGSSNTDADWVYLGELDASFPDGTPADDRCYVFWDNESVVGWSDSTGDAYLNRLSPVDDTTILTTGYDSTYFAFGPNVRIHEDSCPTGRITNQTLIMPVGAWFNDTNHAHFPGFFRNVYMANAEALGNKGTLNNRTFMFRGNTSHAVGPIVFVWDGTTAY